MHLRPSSLFIFGQVSSKGLVRANVLIPHQASHISKPEGPRSDLNDQLSLCLTATTMSEGPNQAASRKNDEDDIEDITPDQRPKTPVLAPKTNLTSPSSTNWGQQRNSHPSPSVGDNQKGPSAIASLTCPFMPNNPVRVGDSRTTWSPYGSVTPRPDSLASLPKDQETMGDPIAAEARNARASSPPPSVNGVTSKCPIRFLDKHSPEELAAYFSHHKHEIPRSHEICVRRYQSNSENIRQLDAKYANLASLIQDLGVKHLPMLTTKDADGDLTMAKSSAEKVEEWADNVKELCRDANMEDTISQSKPDSRVGVFDRPFKEVRVGESPSRPWGIPIPFPERQAQSTTPARGVSGNDAFPEVVSKHNQHDSTSSYLTEEELPQKFMCPRNECLNSPENGFEILEELALHILNDHKWETYLSKVKKSWQTRIDHRNDPMVTEGEPKEPTPSAITDAWDLEALEVLRQSTLDNPSSCPWRPNKLATKQHPTPTPVPDDHPWKSLRERELKHPTPANPVADHHLSEESTRAQKGDDPITFDPAATATAASNAKSDAQHIPSSYDDGLRSLPPAAAAATTEKPQMVFTGPVFIGYSAEQAAVILQGLGYKS